MSDTTQRMIVLRADPQTLKTMKLAALHQAVWEAHGHCSLVEIEAFVRDVLHEIAADDA
jgi:hypothetical protein